MSGERRPGRRGSAPGRLPPVAVVEILVVDSDGFATARPVGGRAGAAGREIRLAPSASAGQAVAAGERVLARLDRTPDGPYRAEIIRRLAEPRPRTLLGIYDADGGAGRLRPTDGRRPRAYRVARRDSGGAEPGELVRAEAQPARRPGPGTARVLERLGAGPPWRIASLVAIAGHGIPDRFPQGALDEAAALPPEPQEGREDLRALPLMTIDDATARDFDDAVWAEADDPETNPGGHRAIVAIADVAWYVRPGSELDRAARARGNSVYFPDRVVPMLPEPLSEGRCSLTPGVDRLCLAVHLKIAADGSLRGHRITRAVMRSAARETYETVQTVLDGGPPSPGPRGAAIAALHGVYRALARARARRGTLELDLPEYRAVMAPEGGVERIERRRTLTAHKLIEELMIAANVAAAETLTRLGRACIHRVHAPPDPARVEALRPLLDSFGLPLPRRARDFARLLARAADEDAAEILHEAVLRTQAKAAYAADTPGHFGLGLPLYCHFTSPIRRYADLVNHRAAIAALNLGAGGADGAPEDIARHVSETERRAADAEREAMDRLLAAYLAKRAGARFAARIGGITRAGLFLRFDESGANALVPASFLPISPIRPDANGLRMLDRAGRTLYALGQQVTALLREVDIVTGRLVCTIAEDGDGRRAADRLQPEVRTL